MTEQTPASVVERLLNGADAIDSDATPAQVGPYPDELREAAALIERLLAEREGLREALERIKWRSVCKDNMEFSATITCWQMDAIRAALTQGESRQTLPAAPTPADGGGE